MCSKNPKMTHNICLGARYNCFLIFPCELSPKYVFRLEQFFGLTSFLNFIKHYNLSVNFRKKPPKKLYLQLGNITLDISNQNEFNNSSINT